ncbi:MAG: hypothetical protein HYS22_05935 [Deltaproteobacteria bacterium]|nr:hypothetical protein [Deltaproteobacteria bacterium]
MGEPGSTRTIGFPGTQPVTYLEDLPLRQDVEEALAGQVGFYSVCVKGEVELPEMPPDQSPLVLPSPTVQEDVVLMVGDLPCANSSLTRLTGSLRDVSSPDLLLPGWNDQWVKIQRGVIDPADTAYRSPLIAMARDDLTGRVFLVADRVNDRTKNSLAVREADVEIPYSFRTNESWEALTYAAWGRIQGDYLRRQGGALLVGGLTRDQFEIWRENLVGKGIGDSGVNLREMVEAKKAGGETGLAALRARLPEHLRNLPIEVDDPARVEEFAKALMKVAPKAPEGAPGWGWLVSVFVVGGAVAAVFGHGIIEGLRHWWNNRRGPPGGGGGFDREAVRVTVVEIVRELAKEGVPVRTIDTPPGAPALPGDGSPGGRALPPGNGAKRILVEGPSFWKELVTTARNDWEVIRGTAVEVPGTVVAATAAVLGAVAVASRVAPLVLQEAAAGFLIVPANILQPETVPSEI